MITTQLLHYSLETYSSQEILWWQCCVSPEEQATMDRLASWCDMHHVSWWVVEESPFARLFQSIVSSPRFLFTIGDTTCLFEPLLWIVGARRPSSYVTSVMHDVGEHMKAFHHAIISWWARGVDSIAHRLAMENWTKTIVVLWMWLRYCFGTHTRKFVEKVVQEGWVVISEFWLDQPATHWTFPRRNRLIAGLANALFVPGAGVKSWTSVTIDFALQMDKHVYSVPASVYEPWNEYTNQLIVEKNIHAVTNHDHWLSQHFVRKKCMVLQEQKWLKYTEDEQKIRTYLSNHEQTSIDDIASFLALPVQKCYAMLLRLEMWGVVKINWVWEVCVV